MTERNRKMRKRKRRDQKKISRDQSFSRDQSQAPGANSNQHRGTTEGQLSLKFLQQQDESGSGPPRTEAGDDYPLLISDLMEPGPYDREDSILPCLERVETEADFSEYVLDLMADFRDSPDRWTNPCLHSFLDAVAETVFYLTWPEGPHGPSRPPSWRLFAAVLHAARYYGGADFEKWADKLGEETFEVKESLDWLN
jgi:hypothetical protein